MRTQPELPPRGGGVGGCSPPARAAGAPLFLALFLALTGVGPEARSQQQGQPSGGALRGGTAGENLRNAAAATRNHAATVRQFAHDWGRRAAASDYREQDLRRDFINMQLQFRGLRAQFNWLGTLALQVGRPRATNAATELDAGLNVIAELFTFLQVRYAEGTLDRQTVARTCRAFEDALREWERELKKNTGRLGLVW